MLHALNPIEKTICKKIILTAVLLFALLVLPLFFFYENISRLGHAARVLIPLFACAAFLTVLARRVKKIISRHVSKPLDELSKLADEVAAGNYYAHASVFSDTEVGSLAKNLNFMVEMTSKHTAGLEETLSAAAGDNEKLRAEVEKLKAGLAAFHKKRRDFDALVSVDLKTPLNALINHLEAVCFNGPELKDKCLARLNTLASAVRNAYLDFHAASMAGTGDGGDEDGLIINRGRASFGAIVDRAVEYYLPVIEIKGLTIKKEIAAELSAANIDALKVGSAVNNLVSNAVKFSPAGQTVSINACFEGDSIFFSIADKGCGVSEDIQEKIFLSDFCVSMPGTFNESGFGAGLKLCKLLIEAHGGSFWFEPGRDGGSVFYFKVPAGRPPGRQ